MKPGPHWAGLGWVGLLGLLRWFSFSNFNSISYFYFKQSLNSNKNLNSNHTQKIKTMHQHECNKKVKPMINFNYLRNKIELNAILNTINLRNFKKSQLNLLNAGI